MGLWSGLCVFIVCGAHLFFAFIALCLLDFISAEVHAVLSDAFRVLHIFIVAEENKGNRAGGKDDQASGSFDDAYR